MAEKQNVRFIRKGGRVIPIKGKRQSQTKPKKLTEGMKRNKRDKNLLRADVATGFATGLTTSLFFKRRQFIKNLGTASLVSGGATTVQRFQREDKSFAQNLGDDVVGSLGKGLGGLVGLAGGKSILKSLHKRKIAAKNAKKASSKAKSAAKILRKLL